ncbi:hypothetical protein PTTG_07168 [Puccinia triticina 1-1 BBBD Race 1]|uniref:Retrotransposon gag domain-containing protein n=1 Tax=Puccinia triticina (isolate 1-1 / race 1 (BBBD)) TaxID=630390 RepID=A0A180G8G8_PUCT1|nr:hypothetical protein PTTG_07168 [Puccinia triticina 1-1 BBBD Race 1]
MPDNPVPTDNSAADLTARNQSVNNATEPLGDNIKDWLKQLLKAQHAAALQAQEDRRAARKAEEALSVRAGRLEDLVLSLAQLKTKPPSQSGRAETEGIDMQKFRSDGPIFTGPFQEVKPFVKWVHAMQIYFTTKDVVLSKDKIKVVGNRLAETNLISFYANESANYLNKSWADFKKRMFEVALPINWRMELKKQVKQLSMLPTELFQGYSTRARTLQSLVNFDVQPAACLGDFDLAQYVVFGLPEDFQDRVAELNYMEANPFKYSSFESSLSASFVALRRAHIPPGQIRPSAPPLSTASREEIVWKVHSYLDLQGRCHLCKKTCGNAAGACPGPMDCSFIDVPPSFHVPPKPANYRPPRAWPPPQKMAGRPVHPPAGLPPQQAALVAAISQELANDMIAAGFDETAVAAMVIDDEKRLAPPDDEATAFVQSLGSPAYPDQEGPSAMEVAWASAIDAQVELNEREEEECVTLAPPSTSHASELTPPLPHSMLPGKTVLAYDDNNLQDAITGVQPEF